MNKKTRTITNHSLAAGHALRPTNSSSSPNEFWTQLQYELVLKVIMPTKTNTVNFISNTGTMLHLHRGTNRRLGAVSVGVPRRDTRQIANEITVAITLPIIVNIHIASAIIIQL
jgi:hypothetical protein